MIERERFLMPERKERSITIIVLSSGLHSSEVTKSGAKLSWDARIRSNAVVHLAKELVKEGVTTRIVVCGGKVYSGYPPLADLMREDINRKLGSFMKRQVEEKKVPQEALLILKADNSLNTIEDIDSGIGTLVEEGVFKKESTIIISSGHHLVARLLAKKRGIDFLSAEKVLGKKDKRYRIIINSIRFTPELAKLFLAQVFGSGLLLVSGEEKYKERSRETLPQRAVITEFDPYGLPGKKRPVRKE